MRRARIACCGGSFEAARGVQGKGVVITGASSGIGEELAYQMARQGARLVIAARRDKELHAVADKCRSLGAAHVEAVRADLSDSASGDAFVAAAIAAGPVDIVFLNHAVTDTKLLAEYNSSDAVIETYERTFRTNVLGSIRVGMGLLPKLEEQGGVLVVVGSGSALVPAPFHSAYVTSKRAITGWAETLRSESRLTGRWANVTISMQVLGLIGTQDVLKHENLRTTAMPVDDCAHGMLCATAARELDPIIPGYLSIFIGFTRLFPRLGDRLVDSFYTFRVPEYVQRIRAVLA
jgi:corticosteroid 11-beta-dehydrogenase isozyme 1